MVLAICLRFITSKWFANWFSVGSATNYFVLSIDGSGDLAQISPATAGYVLTSNGTSAAATFQPASGSLAIGNPVGSGTATCILFVDGSGDLGQSTTFQCDITNHVLQIQDGGGDEIMLGIVAGQSICQTGMADFYFKAGGGSGIATLSSSGNWDAASYSVGGTAGFSGTVSNPTSITIVNGIVTACS